jgi:septum formation protein
LKTIAKIILASGSPRRRELLRVAGIPFRIVKSRIEEKEGFLRRGSPASWARGLAYKKASGVARSNTGDTVLGADTIVVVKGKVLGKPKNENDARKMLDLLSGEWHQVITGVAIVKDRRVLSSTEKTRVKFRRMTRKEIKDYVASGESMDKAGGYAAQGGARVFIERIIGDYTNVVGLPLNLIVTLLARL